MSAWQEQLTVKMTHLHQVNSNSEFLALHCNNKCLCMSNDFTRF